MNARNCMKKRYGRLPIDARFASGCSLASAMLLLILHLCFVKTSFTYASMSALEV